jgi:hypothetical protein
MNGVSDDRLAKLVEHWLLLLLVKHWLLLLAKHWLLLLVEHRLLLLVEHLLLLLVRRRESMWPMCVPSGRNSIPNPMAESRLLHVVCQSRRRNSGLLGVPADGGPGGGSSGVADVTGVAGALFLLIVAHPAPKPKKYQDNQNAAADGASDYRQRRVCASGCSV